MHAALIGLVLLAADPSAHSLRREGLVVDERGRPVGNAWVTVIWRHQANQLFSLAGRSTLADAEGRFAIDEVSSQFETFWRAETEDLASEAFVASAPGSKDSLRLTVSLAGMTLIAGRVVDRASRPIAGAEVKVHAGYRHVTGWRNSAGEWQSEWTLATDADGRFQMPHPLPHFVSLPQSLNTFSVHGKYLLMVDADGHLPYKSWDRVGAASPHMLPDIVLGKPTTVRGRVVDREQRPLEGVSVWAAAAPSSEPGRRPQAYRLTRAASQTDGRFELADVHPSALFIFAERAGYAFTGQPIPRNAADVEFTLATAEEAAADPPLVPQRLSPQQAKAAVETLLAALWPHVDLRSYPSYHASVLKRTARHAPEWTAGQLAQLASPRYHWEVLAELGRLDDAAEAAQAIDDPYERSHAMVWLAERAPDRGSRRGFLAEAAVHARAVHEQDKRAEALGNVGRALFTSGELDEARRLIDEALALAESLEARIWQGPMLHHVAEVDVAQARRLHERVAGLAGNLTLPGEVAVKVAASDPEWAEAIWKGLAVRWQAEFAPKIAGAMAAADPDRARQLVDASPRWLTSSPAYNYAALAVGVGQRDRAEAARLMRQAVARLDSSPTLRPATNDPRLSVGIAMTGMCEQADPSLTRECFWRAVSRWSGVWVERLEECDMARKLEQDARLAILLTRYGLCPEIAADLVEPVLANRWLDRESFAHGAFPMAMAMVDAERSAEWLAGYRTTLDGDDVIHGALAWCAMADAVAGDDTAFWRSLRRTALYPHVPYEDE